MWEQILATVRPSAQHCGRSNRSHANEFSQPQFNQPRTLTEGNHDWRPLGDICKRCDMPWSHYEANMAPCRGRRMHNDP